MATEYGEEEILDESYNDELPPSPAIKDQSYTTTSGEPVPVVKDEDIDEPKEGIEAESAEMLARDEEDVIKSANIMPGDRLRHTRPRGQDYREPDFDEGLPGPDESGSSSMREPVGAPGRRGRKKKE